MPGWADMHKEADTWLFSISSSVAKSAHAFCIRQSGRQFGIVVKLQMHDMSTGSPQNHSDFFAFAMKSRLKKSAEESSGFRYPKVVPMRSSIRISPFCSIGDKTVHRSARLIDR